MPLYLYLLIGKVIPIEIFTLLRSISLFLIAPFIFAYIIQKSIIKLKGREFFSKTFKNYLSEVKLWALVIVIISMFLSQTSINVLDIQKVMLLILFLIIFFRSTFYFSNIYRIIIQVRL